ncbi:hypothetical protein OS493_039524, partial [Desmophyllum pertusum]
TAGKTGIAGQVTTVTNTTENVMLASQCPGYNPRAVVTTCAAAGMECVFGFCRKAIPRGTQGAKCKKDRKCDSGLCCVKKCPCSVGLTCKKVKNTDIERKICYSTRQEKESLPKTLAKSEEVNWEND